jgi:hypothetical protein
MPRRFDSLNDDDAPCCRPQEIGLWILLCAIGGAFVISTIIIGLRVQTLHDDLSKLRGDYYTYFTCNDLGCTITATNLYYKSGDAVQVKFNTTGITMVGSTTGIRPYGFYRNVEQMFNSTSCNGSPLLTAQCTA